MAVSQGLTIKSTTPRWKSSMAAPTRKAHQGLISLFCIFSPKKPQARPMQQVATTQGAAVMPPMV